MTAARAPRAGPTQDLERHTLEVVRALQPGEVVSYGDVAEVAGFPGRARSVGRVLAAAADVDLPWWRVVTAGGRLVPGLESEQAARLRAEGVEVSGARVRRALAGRFAPRAAVIEA